MSQEYDPKKIEEEIRKYWRKNDIYRKVRKSTQGNESFFLLDGPPYLTGPPHLGTMLNKVIKDTVLRYWQMKGYQVWDQAGFDTHGLPNEVKTEEELGIQKKTEIGEKISVKKFVDECKKRAIAAEEEWNKVMEKLAIWQDFEEPYLTFDNSYIESEWWFVKQAAEKGLIYRKKRPMYWCPRCMTSLSQNEISDEYQMVEDYSIFVKFPRKDKEDEYFLIWTTTPWTIPGNVAVLLHPDYQYARVQTEEGVLVMAKELVEDVMEKLQVQDYRILNTVDGASLQGKEYKHPLKKEIPKHEELDESLNVHRILNSADLVTLEQGTGCVHTAPGHGQEDYDATRNYDLDVFSPVDEEGKFTQEAGKYEGKYVFDANEEILEDLRKEGLLLHSSTIQHEYPHCWRCKTKIIQRATEQWYIEIDPIKLRMLEEDGSVDWVPAKVRKRFENWLEKGRDWCISRQRYWGAPLPIWVCDECGKREVVGSFKKLEEKLGGLPKEFDPHKPQADRWKWDCKCGGTYERVDDLLDVWCDSGCAPFASMHYPFEKEPFQSLRPMNFIVEGSDQIAKWFYYLMFCNVLVFDKAPSEKVMMHAFVLDEEGKPMSKSLGNVITPQQIFDKMGTDIPRFWIIGEAPLWENPKADLEKIKNEGYKLFSVYWNSVQFLKDYEEGEVTKPESLKKEDEWILSRLQDLVEEGAERYEDCHFHLFCRKWKDFILNDLSRWYIKLIRKRAKEGDQAALWTLESCLRAANLAIAPVAPHLSERIYQDLFAKEESVHQCSFPSPNADLRRPELEAKMELAEELVEKINSIREREGLKLRWPVKEVVVTAPDEVREDIEDLKDIVKRMANLKKLRFGEVETKPQAKPNYPSLGPKFKGDAEEVANLIENLKVEEIQRLKEEGKLEKEGFTIQTEDANFSKETSTSVSGKDFEGGKVFLDKELPDEIRDEIKISELLRKIQLKRKEEGLHVRDKIDLFLESNDEEILSKWRDKIEDRLEVSDITIGELKHRKGAFEFDSWRVKFGFKVSEENKS